MGLFSKIFKSTTKTISETQSGPFTLVYSKGDKNLWSNDSSEVLKSVRGTTLEPNSEQLAFIENIDHEINQLNDKITHSFICEFKDADEVVNFSNWQERFKMVAVDVESISQGQVYWTITFEDIAEPYAHFNLHIEGQKMNGFSIDK